MRNFKEYLELVCEGDITSVRAKMQAKQRGLTHQSHNIWKDKGNTEYKWDDTGKRFEKIEKEMKSNEEITTSDKQGNKVKKKPIKISSFEPIQFSKQIELRNIPVEPISEDLRNSILKKLPTSLKESYSYNPESYVMTCYSKEIAAGHNSIAITKKKNFLIGLKEYSINNKTDIVYATI